jgi:aminoglycoside phosphotransferase (APT) family kinase protein
MRPFWKALADNARPMFDRWAGPELATIQQSVIDSVGQWRPWAEAQPQTLIHNDFNPRNILLRPVAGTVEVCAFDWELATVGIPQRDIAEFLCFALDPEAAEQQAPVWIERVRLAYAEGDRPIDARQWRRGFVAALNELLIDRLAMYAMLHRVRPQPFLPRVTQAWLAIHRALEASQ